MLLAGSTAGEVGLLPWRFPSSVAAGKRGSIAEQKAEGRGELVELPNMGEPTTVATYQQAAAVVASEGVGIGTVLALRIARQDAAGWGM